MINLGNATANLVAFVALLAAYVLLAFRFIAYVYCAPVQSAALNFAITYMVALIFASAGMITLIAIVWEHRTIWPVTATYASAWVNDLFNLCIVAGLLSILYHRLPATHHEYTWWPYLAAVIAIGAGAYFYIVIDKGYPRDVALSPTHLAHAFGAVPIFVYLLLRGAPALLAATKSPSGMIMGTIVVLGIVAFFFVYPVLDVHVLHTYPWNAHGWFDWERMKLTHPLTPQNPGWMPDVLRGNRHYHH